MNSISLNEELSRFFEIHNRITNKKINSKKYLIKEAPTAGIPALASIFRTMSENLAKAEFSGNKALVEQITKDFKSLSKDIKPLERISTQTTIANLASKLKESADAIEGYGEVVLKPNQEAILDKMVKDLIDADIDPKTGKSAHNIGETVAEIYFDKWVNKLRETVSGLKKDQSEESAFDAVLDAIEKKYGKKTRDAFFEKYIQTDNPMYGKTKIWNPKIKKFQYKAESENLNLTKDEENELLTWCDEVRLNPNDYDTIQQLVYRIATILQPFAIRMGAAFFKSLYRNSEEMFTQAVLYCQKAEQLAEKNPDAASEFLKKGTALFLKMKSSGDRIINSLDYIDIFILNNKNIPEKVRNELKATKNLWVTGGSIEEIITKIKLDAGKDYLKPLADFILNNALFFIGAYRRAKEKFTKVKIKGKDGVDVEFLWKDLSFLNKIKYYIPELLKSIGNYILWQDGRSLVEAIAARQKIGTSGVITQMLLKFTFVNFFIVPLFKAYWQRWRNNAWANDAIDEVEEMLQMCPHDEIKEFYRMNPYEIQYPIVHEAGDVVYSSTTLTCENIDGFINNIQVASNTELWAYMKNNWPFPFTRNFVYSSATENDTSDDDRKYFPDIPLTLVDDIFVSLWRAWVNGGSPPYGRAKPDLFDKIEDQKRKIYNGLRKKYGDTIFAADATADEVLAWLNAQSIKTSEALLDYKSQMIEKIKNGTDASRKGAFKIWSKYIRDPKNKLGEPSISQDSEGTTTVYMATDLETKELKTFTWDGNGFVEYKITYQ